VHGEADGLPRFWMRVIQELKSTVLEGSGFYESSGTSAKSLFLVIHQPALLIHTGDLLALCGSSDNVPMWPTGTCVL
jgi:hypothetical protein